MRTIFSLTGIVVCTSAWCGDFGKLTQHKATLVVSRPPDTLLRGKTFAVRMESGERNFTDGNSLKANVEAALKDEFTPSDKPDTVITITVTAWTPPQPRHEVKTESRSVKVGTKTVVSKDGKAKQVDDYQMREVPVRYYVAEGTLQASVAAREGAETIIDTFEAQAVQNIRTEIEENGVSKRASQPTYDSLRLGLLQTVTREVAKRYTKTNEALEARLAVDKELRNGNEMAKVGQWQEALDHWSNVTVKKWPGDRLFNMAVAHEALAYATYDKTRDVAQAAPSFQKAIDLYREAIGLDPEEKYFRRAMERCQELEKNFNRASLHTEIQQRETQQAIEEANRKLQEARRKAQEETARQEEEARQKAELEAFLHDQRADKEAEENFRKITRLRLKNRQAAPSTDEQLDLEKGGATYGLSDREAKRIVFQEVERVQKIDLTKAEYRKMFGDLAADGVIDAEERAIVNDLAKRLRLETAEAAPLETEFKFKDLTQPAAPPARRPAPPAVRTLAPKKK